MGKRCGYFIGPIGLMTRDAPGRTGAAEASNRRRSGLFERPLLPDRVPKMVVLPWTATFYTHHLHSRTPAMAWSTYS